MLKCDTNRRRNIFVIILHGKFLPSNFDCDIIHATLTLPIHFCGEKKRTGSGQISRGYVLSVQWKPGK